MSYPLPNLDSPVWQRVKSNLGESPCHTLQDVHAVISKFIQRLQYEDESPFKTLDAYYTMFEDKQAFIALINKTRLTALQLPILFPTGSISLLTTSLTFTRRQVHCLLCHMFFCTLQCAKHNLYWTTFENWLCDGRTCALVYLRTLFEYLGQSFDSEETIEFTLSKCTELDFSNKSVCNVDLRLSGSIGDAGSIEVDFANMDIGFGVTGTQEEIMFGASPEMCIAMLFCGSMQDDEAIVIRGARRVAKFSGYGMTLKFESLMPSAETQRFVVCIDALDYSDQSDAKLILMSQLSELSLRRELCKAYAGFSSLPKGSAIQTGNWGCGAFCGNRQIKALLQLMATSLAGNDKSLIYFCDDDKSFYKSFTYFLEFLKHDEISLGELWAELNSFKVVVDENFSTFHYLISKLQRS